MCTGYLWTEFDAATVVLVRHLHARINKVGLELNKWACLMRTVLLKARLQLRLCRNMRWRGCEGLGEAFLIKVTLQEGGYL
jgi:hypothetical protein